MHAQVSLFFYGQSRLLQKGQGVNPTKTSHKTASRVVTLCLLLLLVQVLGGIGAPVEPRRFYFHLHSQLASLGITGMSYSCPTVSSTLYIIRLAGQAQQHCICRMAPSGLHPCDTALQTQNSLYPPCTSPLCPVCGPALDHLQMNILC